MPRIEKVSRKGELGWRLVKSFTSRFAAIVGIGFIRLAAPLRAQFAYVANEISNNVSAYRIGANGTLTPVPGSPFAAGITSRSIAITLRVPFLILRKARNCEASLCSRRVVDPGGDQ
jgi:hypothetical protein